MKVAAPRLTNGLIALLAAIGALGSMAIHMLVPALPAVARDMRADPGAVQLAVTLYLVGLGLGQLVAGPLVDGLGRRVVLLIGLTVFIAGALAVAMAPVIEVVLVARVVQAVGGAASIVAVRTIVTDLSHRNDAAARLAMLTTVLLVSPAVSPLVGGAIASAAGWRAILFTIAAFGLVGLAVVWLSIGETLPANRIRHIEAPWRSWGRLVRNARFLRYAAGIACGSSAMYIFLSGSAFLLSDGYGFSPAQAGVCYFLVAVSGVSGTFAVKHLERRGGAFRFGLLATLTGGAIMLALALSGFGGVAALMGPMLLVGMGAGIAAPAGIAGAMHAEDGLSGTAASLAGALQMLASGLTTSLLAQSHATTLLFIAGGILACGALGLLLAPGGRAVMAERVG